MEDVWRFIFFAVLPLSLVGCAVTGPSDRPAEPTLSDPWTVVVAESPPRPPVTAKAEEQGVRGLTPPALDASPALESTDEGDPAFEKVLVQNDWTRNYELQRWMENGMKNPNHVRDPIEASRQTERYHLNNATSKDDAPKPDFNHEMTTGLLSTWRWVHRDLEKLQTNHPPVEPYLNSTKFREKAFDVLRANAAILLGRDGNESAKNFLRAVVENEKLRPEIRCAAVETLGKLPSTTAEDLIPLLDLAKERHTETFNERTGLSINKINPGNLALWTELLTAIAEKVGPWERACFVEPFTARNADIRLETAKIWRRNPPKDATITLPPKFLKFAAAERDSSVRVEILQTLGTWKQPDILPLVKGDLSRPVQVRNAALDAIAATGCREAIPLVQEKLRDPSAKDRAKAVETLRKLEQFDDVFRQSGDKDWEVRAEVAKALTDRRTSESVALAKKYLADYPKVQTATLDAIATWPLEQSGPLLLDAMKGPTSAERMRAAEILAVRWNDAAEFNARDLPQNQTTNHADLRRRFQDFLATQGKAAELADAPLPPGTKENIKEDEILLDDVRITLEELCDSSIAPSRRQDLEAKLTSLGSRLVPMVERLHFEEHRRVPNSLDASVLAKVEPVFAAICKLDDVDANVRRRGISDLSRLAESVPLGRLAIVRIFEVARCSDDQFVVEPLLRILEKSDGDLAREAARAQTDADSSEIRRKACEIFKKHGEGQDLSLLAGQLDHPNSDLVRITLEAIAQIVAKTEDDEFQTEKEKIAGELRPLLSRPNPFLQTDAAATLHYLGKPVGAETLQRLSQSKDSKLQTYVAKTIGNLDDPAFVPILIRLLKVDSGGVRQAALESLPKLVGEDIGSIETPETQSAVLSPTQKKTIRWEMWAKKQ